MILQAALFLAGVSIGSGSLCCAPSQFNALQYVTISNSTTRMRGLYYIVYDGPNQRYVLTPDRLGNYYGIEKVIYDYKKRIAYHINAQTRTCTTSSVEGNFEDQEYVCIPRDAVYASRLIYGFDRATLPSLAYEYNRTTADGRDESVVTTVIKGTCIPILTTTTSTDRAGGNSLRILGYNDFYPGIKDISILDIPPYCP